MSGRTRLWAFVVAILIGAAAPVRSAADGHAADLLRVRVERVAAALPWLDPADVVYDREPRWGPEPQTVGALLRELKAPLPASPPAATLPATAPSTRHWWGRRSNQPLDVNVVRPLLAHADPKVRTLAIVLLFGMDRLDVMPDIAARVDDEAPSFQTPGRISAIPPLLPETWPMEPMTVGQYAQSMIDQYTSSSNELDDLRRGRGLPSDAAALVELFRGMAAKRDPFLNTATLRVAMMRATGGISPMPGERDQRVHDVFMRAQAVPMPRRFFVFHALDLPRYAGERYAPDYLLTLARLVPREVRLAAIGGRRAVDDPDLTPGAAWNYFLARPIELLQSRDAELLLRLDEQHVAGLRETNSQAYASPDYVIAAARLAPARAEEILMAALDARGRGDSGDQIAAALAELGGEAGAQRALNWFFEVVPQRGAFGPGREAILGRLSADSPSRHRRFVARVCRDKRLDTLGPCSTRLLVQAAEGYLGRRLSMDEQVRNSYGIDEAQRDRKLDCLPEWHSSLSDTVNEWDPPSP